MKSCCRGALNVGSARLGTLGQESVFGLGAPIGCAVEQRIEARVVPVRGTRGGLSQWLRQRRAGIRTGALRCSRDTDRHDPDSLADFFVDVFAAKARHFNLSTGNEARCVPLAHR